MKPTRLKKYLRTKGNDCFNRLKFYLIHTTNISR